MASAIITIGLVWLQAVGVLSISGSPSYRSDCNAAYKALNPQHTMCLTDGPGTIVSVNSADVVHNHNLKRAQETDAADLAKVYWDSEAAKVAAHWAAQCGRYGPHDDHRSVPTLPGIYIGQNVGYGYSSFQAVIDAWYNERNHFRFGTGSTNGKAVGHYTQVVSKDVFRIGCGQAQCPGSGSYYVCNYVTGWHSNSPYTQGSQCSACPKSCSSGLCDCKGLICKNAGILDKNTCTCKCQPNVAGEDCSRVVCPSVNNDWRCSSLSGDVCEAKWSGTSDYIKYMCPQKCGLCSGSQTTGGSGGAQTGGNSGGAQTGGNSGGAQTGGNSGGAQTGGNSGGAQTGGNSGGAQSGGNSGTSPVRTTPRTTIGTGGSNQGNSGSCQDNWACSFTTVQKCRPRSYMNGKLVTELCPKLCNKCGSPPASNGNSGGASSSSGAASGSGGASSSGGGNQATSGSCRDNWACQYVNSQRCRPRSYLNGKLVLDICPRLCNKCGSASSGGGTSGKMNSRSFITDAKEREKKQNAANTCVDELICTLVVQSSCTSTSTLLGRNILDICPKLCDISPEPANHCSDQRYTLLQKGPRSPATPGIEDRTRGSNRGHSAYE